MWMCFCFLPHDIAWGLFIRELNISVYQDVFKAALGLYLLLKCYTNKRKLELSESGERQGESIGNK